MLKYHMPRRAQPCTSTENKQPAQPPAPIRSCNTLCEQASDRIEHSMVSAVVKPPNDRNGSQQHIVSSASWTGPNPMNLDLILSATADRVSAFAVPSLCEARPTPTTEMSPVSTRLSDHGHALLDQAALDTRPRLTSGLVPDDQHETNASRLTCIIIDTTKLT